jgi:hypothetical protein
MESTEKKVEPKKVATKKKSTKDDIVLNPTYKSELSSVNERVLSVVQRLQRARSLKRREPILLLKKQIAKFRPHTKKQLKLKASQIAKSAVRARFAGSRGKSYSTLSLADRASVDRLVEPKKQLVSLIKQRLAPKLRAADMKRLSAVRSGKPAKGIKAYISGTISQSYEPKLLDSLFEKSEASGIPFEFLEEVFLREMYSSNDQEVAFNRVNSFIRMGKSYLETDVDLAEKLREFTVKEEVTIEKQYFFVEDEEIGMADFNQFSEATYQGREVSLNKPSAGDVKKSKVFVRHPETGNVVKVNFGDKNMTIKKDNPARRRSFRARHNCDNPGPKHKARYWSCKAW